MAKPLEYNATLVERIDVTDALTMFRVKPDKMPEDRPWFVPGQYCVLGANNAEKPELGSVRRSMSIASAPEDDGPVEFYIRWVAKPESENPLTHLLWKIKAGERIYMRAVAAGVFTVKDTVGIDDPRLRVMVAAGTGSAPFVSMVRSELRRDPKVDLSKWVLLHGASYSADLGYRDELMQMVERNRLRYWGTVSRPKEDAGWKGDTGRVEAFFEGAPLRDIADEPGDDGAAVAAQPRDREFHRKLGAVLAHRDHFDLPARERAVAARHVALERRDLQRTLGRRIPVPRRRRAARLL